MIRPTKMAGGREQLSGIAGLATLLQRAGIDFDGETLADALWLAQQVTAEPTPATAPTTEEAEETSAQTAVKTRRRQADAQSSAAAQQSISLSLGNQPSGVGAASATKGTLQAPAAPALQDTLSLGRAFRPLMRKVPSNRRLLLDEAATAEQTADRTVCIPVLQPEPERWLEVVLVVEESRSAILWKDIIADFQRLLERQGAFRDVRTWSLVQNTAGKPELYSKRHIPIHQQRVRNPREILDPSGRRLVILISDCVSPLWQTGQVLELLKLWYRECPLTLLQMLPEKLWDRSVLGQGFPVELGAFMPVAANAQLLTEGLPIWEEIDLAKALNIPVITLEAPSILAWARVLAGAGNARTAGMLFDEIALDSLAADPEESDQPQTAEAKVQNFRETASPLAQRLAGLMALVPVSPPIIALIQKTLLPESRQAHIAEIVMSGLLEPVQQAGKPPRFQFAEGVRAALRSAMPKSETETVLEAISQDIARRAGISIRSFTALLTLPTERLGGESAEEIAEFARLTRPVLRQLGGRFAALAESLGDVPGPAPLRLELPANWPTIQRCEFEVATLVRDDLTVFEFETATLQIVQDRIEIITESRQGRQLIEPLGPDLTLEMVFIPAGSFVMGSPANEPERIDSEGPQHEVTVPSFFMGIYPVTQAQWRFVAGLPQIDTELNPDPAKFKGALNPVERVTWHEAVEFCARLAQYTGRPYRLPSEAEWEYACRAGTNTPFHFGETITTDLANYDGNRTYGAGPKGEYRKATTPVDHFKIANAFGLCDVHGNVWEWCQDVWHDSYEGAPTDGSAWMEGGNQATRVLRGGSWGLNPRYCRSACRYSRYPGNRFSHFGFRVVCSPPKREGARS